MSDEESESAIDKIYKIEEDIKEIKIFLHLINDNLKILSNKLNDVSKTISSQPKSLASQKITATPGTASPPQRRDVDSDKLVIGSIRTFGYIVNKSKVPIPGVIVRVYDSEGQVVKRRTTDDDGHWSVRLPPGKYGVEYVQEGYKPINRTILLDRTMKKLEVK